MTNLVTKNNFLTFEFWLFREKKYPHSSSPIARYKIILEKNKLTTVQVEDRVNLFYVNWNYRHLFQIISLESRFCTKHLRLFYILSLRSIVHGASEPRKQTRVNDPSEAIGVSGSNLDLLHRIHANLRKMQHSPLRFCEPAGKFIRYESRNFANRAIVELCILRGKALVTGRRFPRPWSMFLWCRSLADRGEQKPLCFASGTVWFPSGTRALWRSWTDARKYRSRLEEELETDKELCVRNQFHRDASVKSEGGASRVSSREPRACFIDK